MSFFYMGSVGASVIGLPLGGALLNMHGFLGLAGWRWLFLIEGVPAIVLGIVVLVVMRDTPHKASWLDRSEADALVGAIRSENVHAEVEAHVPWHRALTNPTVMALAVVWLLQAFCTIGVTLFMPLILSGLAPDAGSFVLGLLAAAPFLAACVFMYLNGRNSDRTGERSRHLGLPLIAAGICMALAPYSPTVLAYLLLILAVGLTFALTPVFWAATTQKVAGVAAAASIAFINTVAQFAGLGLPPALGAIKDARGSYDLGLLLIAAALVIGGVLGLLVTRDLRGRRPGPTPATDATSEAVR